MITNKYLFKNLKPYLNCKDFSVSKESFSVFKNEKIDLLITQPVPKNIDKYYESEQYISHTDGKKNWFEKLYQIVKTHTLKKKLHLINSLKTNQKTILDIGAGTGDFLNLCKKNNWDVFGIEPNEKARKIAATKNIFLEENSTKIKTKQFDVITMWHVLEHIPNLIEHIKLLKNLLKPTGVLIIAVPNYKSFDAHYYKNYWAAFDVPRHLWHFSKKSITYLFSKENIKVVKILPMKFDAYYVSLLSEKYKTKKMNFIKAFYIGFKSNWKAKHSKEYSSLIYVLKKEENLF